MSTEGQAPTADVVPVVTAALTMYPVDARRLARLGAGPYVLARVSYDPGDDTAAVLVESGGMPQEVPLGHPPERVMTSSWRTA